MTLSALLQHIRHLCHAIKKALRASPGPLPSMRDSDMGGQFNNKNAGKRGISLNIGHQKGLQIAKNLVRICDVVAEGFSPGVLQLSVV